ncbi:hypothetical protein MML48_2g00007961 [Holotrichia oblita]|uniref:Uncharacterized protein n=1 Tax=Holotrichia oblita TaxID=644536 RepID=A0ACB9TMA9_HOLOL|nr:hypothetical protein MML48_2g00007961 [Holotrichia oblita]
MEQIKLFLENAEDEKYLLWKVVLIMGVSGAMRRDELTKITVDNIQDTSNILIITVPDTKTDINRTFTITNPDYIRLYHKYIALRPKYVTCHRLFLRYKQGRCYAQVIGVHSIGKIPCLIANYLGLPNSEQYTGHCFRRSSATLLANSGATISVLKRHGGWKSATVAESYVEDSIENKNKIANSISGTSSQCIYNQNEITATVSNYNSNKNLDFTASGHPPEQQSNVGAPKLEYPGQLSKLSNSEKHFISQLLLDIPKDALLKKTAQQIINSDVIGQTNYDLSSIQLAVAEKQIELPQSCKTAIPVVLSFPSKQVNGYEGIIDDRQDIAKRLVAGDNPPMSRVYKPEFVTLAPPLMNCQDEPVWMNVINRKEHTVAYDMTMCVPNMAGQEVRQLLTKAYKSALTLQQQQQLLTELENDSKLVYHIGLTPSKLPELVENNPIIAIEVLLKLMQSKQITEYFSVLVNMEMSLHSMEVVNRLTTTVDLPTEFVHLYISNCITTCETIKDKYMQNRLVRLVSSIGHGINSSKQYNLRYHYDIQGVSARRSLEVYGVLAKIKI